MIPESFINELKFRCDIESTISGYVNLKRAGRNLSGLCPFHSEKTPSFTVYPESQSFYCFGCGAGGDTVTFVRRVENLDYIEAVRFLATKAGLTIPEDSVDDASHKARLRIQEINRLSARFFHEKLMSDVGKKARAYLVDRGMTLAMVKKFGVGYAPDSWDSLRNYLVQKGYTQDELIAAAVVGKGQKGGTYDLFRDRIIFPIIDIRGNVIGFGGRILEGTGPKYLNSADTLVFKKSRNLFALNFAKASKRSELILAEGYMDVVSIFQGGFDNAVATLGTSLTEEQARMVASYTDNVVIAYDSDNAGQEATKRAVRILEKTGVKIKILQMQGAKDPDEFIKKFGSDRFDNLINGSRSALDFEIEKLRQKYDIDTSEGKVDFMAEFAKLMANTKNLVKRDVYISKVCTELEISKQAVTLQVDSIVKRNNSSQRKKDARDTTTFVNKAPSTRGDFALQQNPTAGIAEQRIIAYIMKNPNNYTNIAKEVDIRLFVSEIDRAIYELLVARLSDGLSIDMMSMSQLMSDEQINRLAQITSGIIGHNISTQEVWDYVEKLKKHSQNKSSEEIKQLDDDKFAEMIEKIAADKNK